jgi:hypothetical protein
MSKNNKPRIRQLPQANKVPRKLEEPEKLGSSLFRWRVNPRYVDFKHHEWGWGKLSCKDFFDILAERLHEYEQMTWDNLSQRRSCHPMPVENIKLEAQGRLCEICGNEIDSLYQVDINPRCRLWGYRDRAIFYLIWHDPDHTVYQTEKHNT